MSSSPEYTHVAVPARIAGLSFTYLRPAGFNPVDLPSEIPDFEQPAVFFPLEVVMADYGAVLFTVGARPAYGDGTVEDWAEFIARESKMQIDSLQPTTFAGMPAMQMEAHQQSEMGPMRLRTILLEDGTRMLNLTIIAPQALWASVEPTLELTLRSFRLDEERGATAVLTRAAARKIAEKTAALVPPAPADAPARPEAEASSAAELALADNAGTLDPEHPFNVRLRDNGAGLTARVLDTNVGEKCALIGAGAIEATFRVPFGWHAIDDGKRTLIFDAAGEIQISLNLRRADGDHRALLGALLAQAQSDQPHIDPEFVDFATDLPGLVLRNYRDGDDVLVQTFVVKQVRDDGLMHVARVTCSPDHTERAMNLARMILHSVGVEVALAAR